MAFTGPIYQTCQTSLALSPPQKQNFGLWGLLQNLQFSPRIYHFPHKHAKMAINYIKNMNFIKPFSTHVL